MTYFLLLPIAVVAAELIARFAIARGRYYVWNPNTCELLEPDRETHPQLESRVRFATNGLGERGDPIPDHPATFRMLAVGGSAVECYLLDQSSTWPELLVTKLRSGAGRPLHIGNIGKSGVDSRTLDYILERALPNYPSLDLMLIMVGASDVLRWLERGAPDGGVCEMMNVSQCFHRHPEREFRWHPKHCALAELLRYLLSHRPTTRPRAAKWYQKARRMRAAAQTIRETYGDDSAVMDQFDRFFRSCLARASQTARQTVVIRQPWFEKPRYQPEEEALFWNGGIGKAYKEDLKEYFSTGVICELMAKIDRRAVAICEAMGVPHIDLMPVLERSTATYFDHFHFTPAGSEHVADVVAAKIAALHGWKL